jgi:hypothetical protein
MDILRFPGKGMMKAMDPAGDGTARRVEEELRRLVDEYRVRCLWFLRPDYYPSTLEERLRVLDYIERHGDREAFRRAARMRQWLSPNSSARSAGS